MFLDAGTGGCALLYRGDFGCVFAQKRAQTRAEQVLSCISRVLDYQDSWIYVVDYQTRELLYANKKDRAAFAGFETWGDGSGLFGEERLRENLPHHIISAEARLYSPLIGRMLLVKTTPISWVGSRMAYLFTCQDAEAVIGGQNNI